MVPETTANILKRSNNLSRIEEFKNLKFNWDGCGASPMRFESVEAARDIINADEMLAFQPRVFPNPKGYIQLEWIRKNTSIESVIMGHGHASVYYDFQGDDGEFETDDDELILFVTYYLDRK